MSPRVTWRAHSWETPSQASRWCFSRQGSSAAQMGPLGKTGGCGWFSGATATQLFTEDPVCPVWRVRALLMDGGQVSARHSAKYSIFIISFNAPRNSKEIFIALFMKWGNRYNGTLIMSIYLPVLVILDLLLEGLWESKCTCVFFHPLIPTSIIKMEAGATRWVTVLSNF